jgi:hypothetical protein
MTDGVEDELGRVFAGDKRTERVCTEEWGLIGGYEPVRDLVQALVSASMVLVPGEECTLRMVSDNALGKSWVEISGECEREGDDDEDGLRREVHDGGVEELVGSVLIVSKLDSKSELVAV